MAIALNSKDVQKIDMEMAADSQVWEMLKEGSSDITEDDFVGTREVRVNKMKGFTAKDYVRNGDNARQNITVTKETVKLEKEDWMGYDLEQLDQLENQAFAVGNVISEHRRLVSIPDKDKLAVKRLVTAAFATKDSDDTEGKYIGKTVNETVTSDNALSSYDDAEEYMTDAEIVGPFIMFASAAYYKALKNAKGVSKTFSTNEVNINGINRKVEQIDGTDVLIKKVSASRLQQDATKKINYILVPLRVASPVDRVNNIDIIPASSDRNGYKDTVKGLDYYDLIVLQKARPAIYVSYQKVGA